MTRSDDKHDRKEMITPEDFWKSVPSPIKWIFSLGSVLLMLFLSAVGAKSWLESYVDARVDARMKDGAFKNDLINDLNRYLLFDPNGSIVSDPSGLYGDLITLLTVERIQKPHEGDQFLIKMKLSRFVNFQPILKHYGSGGMESDSTRRVSAVDWEIRTSEGSTDNTEPFFLQIFP